MFILSSSFFLLSLFPLPFLSILLLQVESRLNEETKRVQQYLHHDTQSDLIFRCEKVLIKRHQEAMWQEVPQLLKDEKIDGFFFFYFCFHLMIN